MQPDSDIDLQNSTLKSGVDLNAGESNGKEQKEPSCIAFQIAAPSTKRALVGAE